MRGMTTCWWAARRLDRYIDADPSAQLSTVEVQRLERHAATCRRCAADIAERQGLNESLRRVGTRRLEPEALERLDAVAAQLRTSGTGSL